MDYRNHRRWIYDTYLFRELVYTVWSHINTKQLTTTPCINLDLAFVFPTHESAAILLHYVHCQSSRVINTL